MTDPINPDLDRLLKAVEQFCLIYVTDSHTLFSSRVKKAWDELGEVALELNTKYHKRPT